MKASRSGSVFRARPPLAVVLASVVAFWFLMVASSPAGVRFAVLLAAAAAVLFGFGYALLRLVVRRNSWGSDTSLLALAAGIVVLGGASQIAFNEGLGLVVWLLPAAAVVALPGLVWALRDGGRRLLRPMRMGWIYALAFAAVGAIYYLPQSRHDLISTKDGGRQWMYADQMYHEAITIELARVLRAADPPPTTPGFVREKLCYQYGRHAVAAQMAHWLGVSTADALARGTTALFLLAAAMGAVCVGRRTAVRAGQRPLAGLLAVALVMFLPSASLLYANFIDTSARSSWIVTRPPWDVLQCGIWDRGSMDFFDGTSSIVACTGAFAVAALLLRNERRNARGWAAMPWGAMLVTTLCVGMNATTALCCWGVTASWAFLRGWRRWQTYAFLLVSATIFTGVVRTSGFKPETRFQQTMKADSEPQTKYAVFRALVVNVSTVASAGCFLLLGLRSLAVLTLAWGRTRAKQLLLLFVAVYLAVFLVLTLLSYPMQFLGMLLSLFAAAPLAKIVSEFGRQPAGTGILWTDMLRAYRRYIGAVAALLVVALVPAAFALARRPSFAALPTFAQQVFLAAGAAWLIYWALRRLAKSAWRPTRMMVLCAAAAFSAAGCLGTARLIGVVACGWLDTTIVLDAGRAASLKFVRARLPSDALLATTRHNVPVPGLPERSLMYFDVGERDVLLEGWRYATSQFSPDFKPVCRDNARLFHTSDEAEARAIARKYGITHVLLEPGERLGFDVNQAHWLRPLSNPGSMTILAVDRGPQ
jgi:hypothetical protein